jgi:hypothetical protein
VEILEVALVVLAAAAVINTLMALAVLVGYQMVKTEVVPLAGLSSAVADKVELVIVVLMVLTADLVVAADPMPGQAVVAVIPAVAAVPGLIQAMAVAADPIPSIQLRIRVVWQEKMKTMERS